jgi:ferredoxin
MAGRYSGEAARAVSLDRRLHEACFGEPALSGLQPEPENAKTMADKSNKWKINAAGKFYVDDQCIDCDLCREMAGKFFGRSDDGYSFVFKQPETQAEIDACEEALNDCPVQAIGDDGDK